MCGENNLDILLQSMRPELDQESFVFLSSREGFLSTEMEAALMIFREPEDTTILVLEKIAKNMGRNYKDTWAKITLTVHSDLNAAGFLAAILPKLADAGISVNPVSAYFHDHLFLPWEKRDLAMKVLCSVQTKYR